MSEESLLRKIQAAGEERRKELIGDIEEKISRGNEESRLMLYFGNSSPEGAMNKDDQLFFEEALRSISDADRLYLIIDSSGGEATTPKRISKLIRSRIEKFSVIVPDKAKSAATSLCLAADEIFMDDSSELGPIDPIVPDGQGGWVKANSLFRGFQEIEKRLSENEEDNLPIDSPPRDVDPSSYYPLVRPASQELIGECLNSAESSKEFVEKALARYMLSDNKEKVGEIAGEFATGYKSHSEPITKEEVKNLGLKVVDLTESLELRDLIRTLYLETKIRMHERNLVKVFETHADDFKIQKS